MSSLGAVSAIGEFVTYDHSAFTKSTRHVWWQIDSVGIFMAAVDSFYSSLLVVEVHFLFRHLLVEHDLSYDHALVANLDGGCFVGFVYFGAGCHCSFDDYEGFLL